MGQHSELASPSPSSSPKWGGVGSPPATLVALQSLAFMAGVAVFCAVSWGIVGLVVYALS